MAAGNGVRQALSAGTHRFFYALWPDARVRGDLARAARRMHGALHGRRTPDESIHLTLAFVGEVDRENLPRLLTPPADVSTSAFALTLDEWGCWARSGIGWAAPSLIPAPLRDLAANLEAWLRSSGFEPEHRAFTPHVTLIRQAQCVPLAGVMTPIAWQIREFALIRSQLAAGGTGYETIRAWPLT